MHTRWREGPTASKQRLAALARPPQGGRTKGLSQSCKRTRGGTQGDRKRAERRQWNYQAMKLF